MYLNKPTVQSIGIIAVNTFPCLTCSQPLFQMTYVQVDGHCLQFSDPKFVCIRIGHKF